MPEETTAPKTKTKGKRGPRANYQRDLERVKTYIETVIRVMARSEESKIEPSEFLRGQLTSYQDVLDFMGER